MLQRLDLCDDRDECCDSRDTLELVQCLEGLECLQHVQLLQVCCTDLHFDRLVALTSLTLHTPDSQDVPNHFFMPDGLQFLDFSGCCLFDSKTQHNLQDLTALTDLRLDLRAPVDMTPAWQPALPALSASLRQLTLTGWISGSASKYRSPDWSLLQKCSNLEHLSVPTECQEDLQSSTASTLQLHISDKP